MAIATFIIPTGSRHVPLLPRAINSAYAQTLPVEVLYHIDTRRRGPAYGRNLLAAQAKTPFVITLDADDFVLPTFTERLLAAWERGHYVTSDWYQGSTHVKAIGCYGVQREAGEAGFHLPPSLMPTRFWTALGGQDETLFGAEDTDWFFKANYERVRHKVVREPLFYYTADGFRAREAAENPEWRALLGAVYGRYGKGLSMGCCNKGRARLNRTDSNEQQAGDILVSPTWSASQRTKGRVTGRNYGVIGKNHTLFIAPEDYHATPQLWRVIQDWNALSPTDEEIAAALAIDPNDKVAVIEQQVKRVGVRASYTPVVKYGYDLQQNPREIATFIAWCEERGYKTFLEIGTGESGGLARLLLDRDWTVTSIDLNAPSAHDELMATGRWTFIQGDTRTLDTSDLEPFDVVFIDGDHSMEGVTNDYNRFSQFGKVVGFHDISPDGFFADSVVVFWREKAYTKGGKLRANAHEIIVDRAGLGIGWIDQS